MSSPPGGRDLLTVLSPVLALLSKGFDYAGGSLSIDDIHETFNRYANSIGDDYTAGDDIVTKEIREIQIRASRIPLGDDAVLNIGANRRNGELKAWILRRQPDGQLASPPTDQNKFMHGETRMLLNELMLRHDEVIKALNDLAERKTARIADNIAVEEHDAQENMSIPEAPETRDMDSPVEDEAPPTPGFTSFDATMVPPFCSGALLLRTMFKSIHDIEAAEFSSKEAVTCRHCFLDIQTHWDLPSKETIDETELTSLAKYHVAAKNPKPGHNVLYRCSYCPESDDNLVFSSPSKFSVHLHGHLMDQKNLTEYMESNANLMSPTRA